MARVALATGLLLSIGCTGADDPSAAGTTTPSLSSASATPDSGATPTAATPTAATPTAAVPAAATEQLDWVLGVIAGSDVSAQEYERRFGDAFRAQVPYEDFPSVLEQLRTLSPLDVTSVRGEPPIDLVAAATSANGEAVRILIDLAADDRIETFLVQPAEPPTLDDPPTSPQAAADRLADLGTVRLAASQIDGTTCTLLVDRRADEPAPIGSAFKLYVLGALADAITAGDVTWDEQLTITADVKSLPSGVLQQRDDGSTVTVRDAATKMITISDNTATDLLIRRLGRDAVEAAQEPYGHTRPELNQPLPTTRELFALKTADAATRRAWIDGDEARRGMILDDLADVDIADISVAAFTEPIAPDTIEWFASPLDLCRALATLWERAQMPQLAPLADILTENPGVPPPADRWSTLAFKGGSEPGLVAAAWLMIDDAGQRFALTGAVVDPESAIDQDQAILLLAAARDTVGQRQ